MKGSSPTPSIFYAWPVMMKSSVLRGFFIHARLHWGIDAKCHGGKCP